MCAPKSVTLGSIKFQIKTVILFLLLLLQLYTLGILKLQVTRSQRWWPLQTYQPDLSSVQFCPYLEQVNTSAAEAEAMTHYESTPFDFYRIWAELIA